MSTQVTTIVYAISAMGSDGSGVYEALTDHSSSRIRKISWQRYLTLSSGWNKPKLWLPATKDRDKGVREAVLNMLRGRPINLNSDDMASLVKQIRGRQNICRSTLTVDRACWANFPSISYRRELNRSLDEHRAMGSRKVLVGSRL